MATRDEKQAPMVTMTVDELNAMIDARVQSATGRMTSAEVVRVAAEAIKGSLGLNAEGGTEEARFHARMGTPIPLREPQATMAYACENTENGARFTAWVVPSRAFPAGRTVKILDYAYPKDIVQRMGIGEGMVHRDAKEKYGKPAEPGQMGLSALFVQRRYEAYERTDLQLVGKSAARLPRMIGPDGMPVPAVPVDLGEVKRTA